MAFSTERLRVVTSPRESQAVQESNVPAIVISASGMATGGRVLHHLRRALPDKKNTILFVGYQSVGTRGRQIRDGAKFTRIHGEEIPVAAEVASFDSMSAHADANEIMRWLGHFTTPPKLTCLVHGEPEPMDVLKARIERELKWTVKTPLQGERITL
jgi:metallo-beta-lactamase family protein